IHLQKVLKPAIWLPGLRYPHNWRETWNVAGSLSPDAVLKDVGHAMEKMKVVDEGEAGFLFHLEGLKYSASDESGRAWMVILTKNRWMDIVEINVHKKTGGSEVEIEAHGYSTGLLPLCIPGAVLLNVVLCFFPFSDRQIIGKEWMPMLRKHMDFEVTRVDGSAHYQC
ncbi:unnamed protein product, partial [Choristocarpus tenellus]